MGQAVNHAHPLVNLVNVAEAPAKLVTVTSRGSSACISSRHRPIDTLLPAHGSRTDPSKYAGELSVTARGRKRCPYPMRSEAAKRPSANRLIWASNIVPSELARSQPRWRPVAGTTMVPGRRGTRGSCVPLDRPDHGLAIGRPAPLPTNSRSVSDTIFACPGPPCLRMKPWTRRVRKASERLAPSGVHPCSPRTCRAIIRSSA